MRSMICDLRFVAGGNASLYNRAVMRSSWGRHFKSCR